MEYTFGKTTTRNGDWLSLKTKGESHTSLSGEQTITKTYADSSVSHNFTVVSHYKTAEDAEGNCYDWYEIEDYSSHVNMSDAMSQSLNGDINDCLTLLGGGEIDA